MNRGLWSAPVVAAALGLLAFACPAGAAEIGVDVTNDERDLAPGVCEESDSDCALREAIDRASALPGADTINLPPGTFTISLTGAENTNASGDLDVVAGPTTIQGAGAGSTVVTTSGAVAPSDRERLLDLLGGSLTITDLALRGGRHVATGSGVNGTGGGAIQASGALALLSVSVESNEAPAGGGGGIALNAGALEIQSSLLAGNAAPSTGTGGALLVTGGSANLVNTTVDGNAAGGGGGIQLAGPARLTAISSTLSGNSAPAGAGANLAGSGGPGALDLRNTLVAYPAGGGADCAAAGAESFSSGTVGSLSSDSSCALPAGNLRGVDPLLGALSDNGGPTRTRPLPAVSPAVDSGSSQASGCPPTDQRGMARGADGNGDGAHGCDIGAFEAQVPVVVAATEAAPRLAPAAVSAASPAARPGAAPTVRDASRPRLSIRVDRNQNPFEQSRSILIAASVNEPSRITFGGTVAVGNGARAYRLRRVRKRAASGKRVQVQLPLPSGAVSPLGQALRRGGRGAAHITVTAYDTARNRSSARRRISLSRRG